MFECCQDCGHEDHSEICNGITRNKKCPCKIFIAQQFNSFGEVYREYEKLLFQYEKDSRKKPNSTKESRKNTRQVLCINSKIRILKKWLDENRK